ncbi:hypothetical protein [Maridesulfovibrio ferrireducens]|uniref:hypothetical protein n=1 Tax=Maridesulfovibrio ferrireducens TaxID=246191 RepID=UPI001A25E30D|nr:hypothetical protein [Maridesulfovibrio ferrireducens]MBI9112943.1 hypothetical protein [Maridesulfovibrio ferrireducens]
MRNIYNLTPEELEIFDSLEDLASQGIKLCNKLKEISRKKFEMIEPGGCAPAWRMLPDSGDLYGFTNSYKDRYVAANILLDSAINQPKKPAPVLRLVAN